MTAWGPLENKPPICRVLEALLATTNPLPCFSRVLKSDNGSSPPTPPPPWTPRGGRHSRAVVRSLGIGIALASAGATLTFNCSLKEFREGSPSGSVG